MIFVRASLLIACALVGSWTGVLLAALLQVPSIDCLLVVSGLIIGIAASPRRFNTQTLPNSRSLNLLALSLIAITLVIRCVNIGWSEFQGDEARAILLARKVMFSDVYALFTHRKGPGEILSALSSAYSFGFDSEFLLRLPFALCGVGVLCATAGIVWYLASPLTAFLAFILIAQDGVILGFSRIVQYQMPMLLLALSGWILIVTNRWRKNACWLMIFFGTSLWCHYDAIFLVIPGLITCLYLAWRKNPGKNLALNRIEHIEVFKIICVTIILAAAFYIPFIISPSFSETQNYLSQRAISSALPTFNFPRWFRTWNIYSGAAASAALCFVFIFGLWRRLGALFIVILCAASFVFALLPAQEGVWYVMLMFLVIAGLVYKKLLIGERVTLAIFLLPLFLFGFWFAKPNTHFLIATPVVVIFATCLLRGASQHLKVLALGSVTVAFIWTGIHQYNLFFAQNIRRPQFSSSVVEFGFSHRTGLKDAADFLSENLTNATYITNDDPLVARWYLREFSEANLAISPPELALVVQYPREDVKLPISINDNYVLIGRVFVKDQRSIDIFRLREHVSANFKPQRIYAH